MVLVAGVLATTEELVARVQVAGEQASAGVLATAGELVAGVQVAGE